MAARALNLATLCLLAVFLEQTIADKCVVPSEKTAMPDLFTIANSSYAFLVEASYNQDQRIQYITEIYDRNLKRGKLNIEMDGKTTTSVYFSATNEYFETDAYTDAPYKCTSTLLSNMDDQYFPSKFTGWNWFGKEGKDFLIGPSNLFRRAFLDSQDGNKFGKEPTQPLVREMNTNVWTWCYSEDIKIQFYFTDPKTETPYGLKDTPVPVRITVQETWQGGVKENFEFVGMVLNLPETQLNLNIAIPFTIGCQRLTNAVENATDYRQSSMELDAELVFKPVFNNPKGFTYTNNFKLAYDYKNQMTYAEFAPWKSHKDAEIALPGDDRIFVLDEAYQFIFETDKNQGTCKVYKPKDDFSFLTLPDNSKIAVGDLDLFFFVRSDPSEYHYLGEAVERGIPASVFEKYIESTDLLTSLMATRYHVSGSVVEDNRYHEHKAPLKVVYTKIDPEMGQLGQMLIVNFYDYKKAIPKPHQRFDVSTCFAGKDKSKWFQIVFPLDERKASDVIPFVKDIKNGYTSILDHFAQDIKPYRIPKLMVDVDSANIYVTALLLERPDVLLDFDEKPGLSLKDYKPVKLTTKEGCAKMCAESIICQYFTYCGAICTLAEYIGDEGPSTVPDTECTLFRKTTAVSAPTMDEISKTLARAVEERKVKILFEKILPNGKLEEMEFFASRFRDNIAYGLDGLKETPEGTGENRFSVYKFGSKMKKDVADEGHNEGSLSMDSCKQGCMDKETCESFSYCQMTKECLMSSKFGPELADNELEPSTQCVTQTRNYVDLFEHYQGLFLNHDAEKMVEASDIPTCAKACLKETDFACKSFDFCPTIAANAKPCWLHAEHFAEISEHEHVKTDQRCGHYSRKYLSEFKQDRHKDMSEAGTGAQIANITAEECSRLCRDNSRFYCKGFDHCFDPLSSSSVCTLRDSIPSTLKVSATCNAYTRQATKTRTKRSVEGHSKGSTGGLGFLMLLIGLGLGVGGIYGYGYWRANRR